jgi:hypothetical protein
MSKAIILRAKDDGRYGVFFAAYLIASIDLTKPESVGDVSRHVSAMSPG